jgi:regulator of RNase E activity RraA
MMKRAVLLLFLLVLVSAARVTAQPGEISVVDGFRTVEVASVSDAFAGPAVTVQLKKEEHKEGAAASRGMLDLIDPSPAGSVYVMVLENGADYAGIGGLMATAMKYRGFAGVQSWRRAVNNHQSLPRERRQCTSHVRWRPGESRATT